MKNKALHEFINGLQPTSSELPLFQQRLRRTVLNQPRHRSRLTSLGRRFIKPAESQVKRRQKVIGLGSMAMVLLLVLSVGVYSYRFSPKAVAEQTINEGLITLQATPVSKMDNLFTQLGGDPTKVLQEAKDAKDLTVITKAEFDAESAKAPGIFASSLSGPGQPDGSKSGAIGGNVMVSSSGATVTNNAPTTSPAGTMSFSSESGATTASGPTTTSVSVKEGTVTTASGTATPVGGTLVQAGPNGAPMPVTTSNTPGDFSPVTMPQPSTYLRYTDKNGRTVVLSLDKDGIPIFKTIFMKASDTQNLMPKAP